MTVFQIKLAYAHSLRYHLTVPTQRTPPQEMQPLIELTKATIAKTIQNGSRSVIPQTLSNLETHCDDNF